MVDGVERLFADVLGMDHHHHARVFGQLVGVALDEGDVEKLLHLREHLLLALAHLRIAGHAQPVEERDDRLAAATQF